jgi:hypothetical protein
MQVPISPTLLRNVIISIGLTVCKCNISLIVPEDYLEVLSKNVMSCEISHH